MSEDDKPRGERAVTAKAKLPAAKNIRSPEFKPHGISGGDRSRGPRPSAKTAAQAKKQRRITIALAVVAVLAIAGGTTYYLTRPDPVVTVSGKFGEAPKVTIPKELQPSGRLDVDTVIKGDGHKVANGDTVLLRFAFYQWSEGTETSDSPAESTSKKLQSTWERPAAERTTQMEAGKTQLKGLDKALVGKNAGSRLKVEVPPKEGFGAQGQQLGLGEDDSVLFVVDIMDAFPKNAEVEGTMKAPDGKDLPKVEKGAAGKGPKVTVPKADPPEKMRVETLIEGTGPATTKDDTAIVNYKGLLWRNGKEFDSSWGKEIAKFPLNTKEGMKGFFEGLQGKKVGSRVMLILPPEDGYGKDGNPQAGIKGTDTTVFVVDILGTMPK